MADFQAARELASLARSHTHSLLTLALDIVTDHFLAVSMQYTPLKSLGKQERKPSVKLSSAPKITDFQAARSLAPTLITYANFSASSTRAIERFLPRPNRSINKLLGADRILVWKFREIQKTTLNIHKFVI